ncbi:MAG: hypothetical protein PVG51_15665, partial [Desulfosarcina sp.]
RCFDHATVKMVKSGTGARGGAGEPTVWYSRLGIGVPNALLRCIQIIRIKPSGSSIQMAC